MESVTLQVGNSVVNTNDLIGQLQFAAPSESDGGAATYIVGRIYSQAEGAFTSVSNPASVIIATSAADSSPATGRLKISHEGHVLPMADDTYDLGSNTYRFRNLYSSTTVVSPEGSFETIFFDTTQADVDQVAGQLNWNDTVGTLDLGLTDTLTTHLGQDVFYRVINLSGGTIYQGQAVYASGVNAGGQRIEISKFVADGSIPEVRYIGLLAETLNNGDTGYVTHFGHVRKVDLRSSNTALNPNAETWADGDILYPDASTAGGLTKVAPQDVIYTAIVLADGQNGELLVRITNPGHIGDLHDVSVTGLADNNLLVYDSASGLWQPSTDLFYVSGDLGIGTSTPSGALHVVGEAYVDNLKLDGNTLSTTTGNLILTPNGTSGIAAGSSATATGQYSVVSGGAGNTASNSFGVVAGGWSNVNSAGCAAIGGGRGNNIQSNSTLSYIGGGYGNLASGNGYNFIGGGRNNCAPSLYNSIAGGQLNCVNGVNNTQNHNAIGGGCTNYISSGSLSVIAGGSTNCLSGSSAVVGGGRQNSVTGHNAVIAGGACNCAGANWATVSGGYANTASGAYSVVAGGGEFLFSTPMGNCATAESSSVLGGFNNLACGYASTIGGGGNNVAGIDYAFVGGGLSNTASGSCSTVAGGRQNTASSNYSTVSGGYSNLAASNGSAIGGGRSNCVTGFYATVSGGYNNKAVGEFSVIAGGGYLYGGCNLACGPQSSILGGRCNTAIGGYSSIGGGDSNTVCGNWGTVSGGYGNLANCEFSTVSGGILNSAGGTNSSVSGGRSNITNARHSTINGGHRNIIQSPTNECCSRGVTIGGGVGHNTSGGTLNATTGDLTGTVTCFNAGSFSTISGGLRNCATGCYSSIGGGNVNTVAGSWSTISGGYGNNAIASTSVIAGGTNNTVCGDTSTISGGYSNLTNGSWSTVSGGYCNSATSDYGAVGGGAGNTAAFGSVVAGGGSNSATTEFSAVGGGSSNSASAYFAVVAGGCNNTANGLRSSILGGGSNHTCGYSNAHIIGSNICATQADTTYTENIISAGDVTISGHLSASTKSFLINHPSRKGHKLQYGSLESPYHGVRLTGKSKVDNGWCVVKLPEYIKDLVSEEDVNIQITNYKHSVLLYVSDIDVNANEFKVKTDSWFKRNGLEFFWSFTAVRKDIAPLKVEY